MGKWQGYLTPQVTIVVFQTKRTRVKREKNVHDLTSKPLHTVDTEANEAPCFRH